jgi:hypothetical protein
VPEVLGFGAGQQGLGVSSRAQRVSDMWLPGLASEVEEALGEALEDLQVRSCGLGRLGTLSARALVQDRCMSMMVVGGSIYGLGCHQHVPAWPGQ